MKMLDSHNSKSDKACTKKPPKKHQPRAYLGAPGRDQAHVSGVCVCVTYTHDAYAMRYVTNHNNATN